METQEETNSQQPALPEQVLGGNEEPKTPEDDLEIQQRSPKSRRTEEPTSPTSPTLHAAFFAGKINMVTNDFEWEDELMEEFGEECVDMEEEIDEGKPPQLNPSELQKVDEEAGVVEITRLLDMGVMETPTAEEAQQGTLLTTTSVYDWRFRNKKWQRRCRLVAREFRGADHSTAQTFAPTSNNAGNRVMLQLHLCFRWMLCFLDVKDAFLLVEQKELILIQIPSWWKPEEDDGRPRYWVLRRCLPGQRNAASRWYDHLRKHLEELNFKCLATLPSMFRHKTRSIALCAHVDDLVSSGLEWCLGKRFTVACSPLYPQVHQDPKEGIRFLKRRYFFSDRGITVCPHERYIPSLTKLYNLEGRKPKATPEIASEDQNSQELDVAGKSRFRSALGTVLYLSQDRVDIQCAVRGLSQYMTCPNKWAESSVKHLIMYLMGTEDYGILLPYAKGQNSKLDEVFGRDVPGD